MPNIKISYDLYKKLESLATGFDTPQNVIERLVAKSEGIDTEGIGIEQEENQQSKEIPWRSKKIRSPTTFDVVKQIYPLARDVFEQKADIYDVQDTLIKDVGMNEASALIYVQSFLKMMEGEGYKRAINGTATEYFLEMILADYGQEALKKALSSVDEHIDYYESHGNGRLRKTREIHNKFSKLV